MSSPLRYGIIGCGVIGPTHAEAVSGIADAELVAVCDVVLERATKLAGRFGARAFQDFGAMMATERLDLVSICTPSGYHGAHTCAVMRAGAHVIVEKPMEITRAAMGEMLRVQRASGLKMAVISQHRFDSASVQVHDLVQAGAFGRLVLGVAHVPWWRSQAYYDSGAWRGTWALDGGGVLMNQSIHSIDLLTWLMGRVKRVNAFSDTLVHRMETEDVAAAVLRFANGALGTITATTGAYPGVTTRVEIFGDGGSAVIEADSLAYLHLRRDDREEAGPYGGAPERTPAAVAGQTASNAAALAVTGHALQIADMVRAVREDGDPLLGGEEAQHAVEVILSIYESACTGKEVAI
jgi:UDP-N-acetyl-2-amino-2-deoxyglucuronate dehydrogenase